MAYTGSDYFMQVALTGTTSTSKVRDFDLNDKLKAKGSMLFASAAASGDLAQLDTLAIGSAGQVLTVNNGVPAWSSASAAAGVNDAKLQLKIGAASASDFFSANAANAATLSIDAGSTNGYLLINNTALQVPGTDILQDVNMTSVTTLERKLVTDGFAKTSDIKDAALNIKIGSANPTKLFSANTSTLATITIAQGSTAGYLSFNGVGISVPGVALASDVPAVANDGKLRLSVNGTAADFWSANSASAATLAFATGSANGTIKVGSTNVAVYGLKSAAYAETSAFDAAGTASSAAASALADAKTYTDQKISSLGSVMTVKGTTSTVPTSTTGNKQGDVYIVTSGDHAGEEYVWTGSAWELMGTNSIDLSGYVPSSRQVAGISLTSNISVASLSTALDLKALAHKASASTTVTDYATGVNVTGSGTDTTSINAVKASGASKVSGFNGGSAAFVVNDGVLSLDFTAATATIANATESAISISHKTYSGSLTTGNKTITVS